MRPAKKNTLGKRIAGIAALTLFVTSLFVGSAHGRMVEWISAEYIHVPADQIQLSSDCLTPEGQTIRLGDWAQGETSRTISITVSGAYEILDNPTTESAEESAEEATEDPESTPAVAAEEASADTGEETQTDSEASATEDDSATDDTQESTEPDQEQTDSESSDTVSGSVWTDGTVTVTMDSAAVAHLVLGVERTSNQIQVTLIRQSETDGLAEAAEMSFHVTWKSLQGTFAFQMEPYGDVQAATTVTETEERPETVTGLELFTACDVMDTEEPVSIVKLNTETRADFTLRFSCDNAPVYRVRYSLDGGATYTMLYETHEMTVSWPYPENWDGTVCLDFGQAQLSADQMLATDQRPTIHVTATDYAQQEYIPVRMAAPKPLNFVLMTEELPYVVNRDVSWGSAKVSRVRVERLTYDDADRLTYINYYTLEASEAGGIISLTPATKETLPLAGSYRLTIVWSWGGVQLKEHTVYFFVNTH